MPRQSECKCQNNASLLRIANLSTRAFISAQQMNDISINYALKIVIQTKNGSMTAIYNGK